MDQREMVAQALAEMPREPNQQSELMKRLVQALKRVREFQPNAGLIWKRAF